MNKVKAVVLLVFIMVSLSACSETEIDNAIKNTEAVPSVIAMTEQETYQYLDMILQDNIKIQDMLNILSGMGEITHDNASQAYTYAVMGIESCNEIISSLRSDISSNLIDFGVANERVLSMAKMFRQQLEGYKAQAEALMQ